MSKGQKKLTRGQRFEMLEKKVENVEMSTRISQMMIQQMGQALDGIKGDITSLAPQFQNIQYTLLAMQELLDLDKDKMDEISNRLRLKDWNEANDKTDKDGNFIIKDKIDTDQDVIIMQSTTPDEDEDQGFFRSRMLVADMGPDLSGQVVGKSVGDTFEHTIRDVKHVIEIIGVREAPPTPEAKDDGECDADCKCVVGEDCKCTADSKEATVETAKQ